MIDLTKKIIAHIDTHLEVLPSPSELDKLTGTLEKILRIQKSIESGTDDKTIEFHLIVEHENKSTD